MHNPSDKYTQMVECGAVQRDVLQLRVACQMDDLLGALIGGERPRGMYVYGDVGRGKSMLMDIFHSCIEARGQRSLRIHFHNFMTDIHKRLKERRRMPVKAQHEAQHGGLISRMRSLLGRADAPSEFEIVATEFVQSVDILCLDEFQINDIADASIIERLFEALFARGVAVVLTSNTAPARLYENGLNRGRFLPFIGMLQRDMQVVNLDGDKDYRTLHAAALEKIYHTPLGEEARAFMQRSFAEFCEGRAGEHHPSTFEVEGRNLTLTRTHGTVAWCDFAELCGDDDPLGTQDYAVIAQNFHILLIDNIPAIADDNRNQALRFIHLIDQLYEAGTICIFAAQVAEGEIYQGANDIGRRFARTASRIRAMQTQRYLARS